MVKRPHLTGCSSERETRTRAGTVNPTRTLSLPRPTRLIFDDMLRATARRRTAQFIHQRPPAPPVLARRTPRRGLTTSSGSPSSWTDSRSRISTVFSILIGVGVASTAYGVYVCPLFYTILTLNHCPLARHVRPGTSSTRPSQCGRPKCAPTSTRALRRNTEETWT